VILLLVYIAASTVWLTIITDVSTQTDKIADAITGFSETLDTNFKIKCMDLACSKFHPAIADANIIYPSFNNH
jgi:hypothetical protein